MSADERRFWGSALPWARGSSPTSSAATPERRGTVACPGPIRRDASKATRWTAVVGLLGLGLRLVGHGPFHEQIRELTLGLEAKPGDASLLARRCDIERAHGLWTEAAADLVLLEKLTPSDPTNGLRRGIVLLGQGDAVAAVGPLATWVAAHPEGVEERLSLAQALMQAKRWEEGANEFTRVLDGSREPRIQVYLDRARCQQEAGVAATNILAGLDEGIARIGSLPQLQRAAAELDLQRGAVEAAVARIGLLAERSERKERWWFERGELYRRSGRPEDAARCYQASLKALEALPAKFQRAVLTVELRRELEQRLGKGGVR